MTGVESQRTRRPRKYTERGCQSPLGEADFGIVCGILATLRICHGQRSHARRRCPWRAQAARPKAADTSTFSTTCPHRGHRMKLRGSERRDSSFMVRCVDNPWVGRHKRTLSDWRRWSRRERRPGTRYRAHPSRRLHRVGKYEIRRRPGALRRRHCRQRRRCAAKPAT